MARRVIRSEDFVSAVAADLQRLNSVDRVEWFDLLQSDLADVEELISILPRAGRFVASRDKRELRKKALRRTPFIVFYDFEPGRKSGPVRMIWLVHQRARATKRVRY